MRQQPLIVGAGPAGTAAAIMLARGGLPPVVLERARETGDALCGGFVSWRTIRTLEQLGIDADALNPSRIVRARIFAGGRCGEAMLPRPALAVSRRRLDSVMQAHAAALGATIERGVTVRAIDARTVTTADGASITPEALLLASGKHDVRGVARPVEARGHDPVLGLRIRIAPSSRIRALVADAIELHLFDRGYCGIVLQEDGSVNACMAVHRSRLHDAGSPRALLHAIAVEAPALADRIGTDWGAIDAIANVPYGWRTGATTVGVFRLGDQAAVIPSLAGEGIGIAVASGQSSARALLADGATGSLAWQRGFARSVTTPVRNAGFVWSLAEQRWSAPLLPLLARIPRALGAVAASTRVPAL